MSEHKVDGSFPVSEIDTRVFASDIEVLRPSEEDEIPSPVGELLGTICNNCNEGTLVYGLYKGESPSAFCPSCDTPVLRVF